MTVFESESICPLVPFNTSFSLEIRTFLLFYKRQRCDKSCLSLPGDAEENGGKKYHSLGRMMILLQCQKPIADETISN